MTRRRYLLVTGRLAEPAVRRVADRLAEQTGDAFDVAVLPITVAALVNPRWLKRHLDVPPGTDEIVVPGYLRDADELRRTLGDALPPDVVLTIGPNDIRDLPATLGRTVDPPDLSDTGIEIIAEINHAPRRSVADVVAEATRMMADGADRIDIGADPAEPCPVIGDYVGAVLDLGVPVSIDSFDAAEVDAAVGAGADLILSVSGSNVDAAIDRGAAAVVIPDAVERWETMFDTADRLAAADVPHRLDPILEPIGVGLTESIVRYRDTRRRRPDTPMMMGVGNLTELTDVDSAGVNFLLLGVCSELRIESILTTQVIPWARSSVAECDIARRLTTHAVKNRTPPKNLSDDLVVLRDRRPRRVDGDDLRRLSEVLKDNNYRIEIDEDGFHIVAAGLHLHDADPFALFERLLAEPRSDNVDAGHAFYLGFELAKAAIARQLGKTYTQDQSLDWGHLTVPEDNHRIARTTRHRRPRDGASEG